MEAVVSWRYSKGQIWSVCDEFTFINIQVKSGSFGETVHCSSSDSIFIRLNQSGVVSCAAINSLPVTQILLHHLVLHVW